jgi:hypothetical protein
VRVGGETVEVRTGDAIVLTAGDERQIAAAEPS